ncbi:hypothetical protein ERJ75_001749000 [Trypanosoma vivax]|nr:hypothetical protein ERJ75_001749000 [Trypanosoma vivax]
MGLSASSVKSSRKTLPHLHPQATLLINGHASRQSSLELRRPLANTAPERHLKKADGVNGEEFRITGGADDATLYILGAVKEADQLPNEKADAKLQILRNCYPYLARVPSHRFDNLAVLLYQKEGDVYVTQGDGENAKTVYGRAIQIAETRVARGEKEIYMVLKRYVFAMVGMARIWYERERDTVGFTFADGQSPVVPSLDDSMNSNISLECSILSENSVFSLNQEILKSMAPRVARRRVGPAVSVVKLLRPAVAKVVSTAEDDFVLRSHMTRELKASPCELLLLRCIEVVEIGHRRQSELLIPALVELAQIYEDLNLHNRALLLVRRCLGILCVVYDYDHPWIVQLRLRADYLAQRMELVLKEEKAIKIQATWKMYRAMCMLEDALGRPVTRHVWIPQLQRDPKHDMNLLNEIVADLPADTVFDDVVEKTEPKAVPMRTMRAVSVFGGVNPNFPHETPWNEEVNDLGEEEEEEATPPKQQQQQQRVVVVDAAASPDPHVVSTSQHTHTETHLQNGEEAGLLTIRTTTVTRTVTEREMGTDEEDSGGDGEDYMEEAFEDLGEVRRRIIVEDPKSVDDNPNVKGGVSGGFWASESWYRTP